MESSSSSPSSRKNTYNFQEVAMIPNVTDGIAIAKILLPKDTKITSIPQISSTNASSSPQNVKTIILNAPCLIGHRFAIRHFNQNEELNSWGLPFGHVVADDTSQVEEEEIEVSSSPCLLSSFFKDFCGGGIMPGDVLMNQAMYKALHDRLGVHQQHQRLHRKQQQRRRVKLQNDDSKPQNISGAHHHDTMEEEMLVIEQLLNTQNINFVDLDVSPDQPFLIETCQELNIVGDDCYKKKRKEKKETKEKKEFDLPSFLGYKRENNRGIGTRNHVIILSLTSSSSSLLQPLLHRWRHYEHPPRQNFDGVRIVTHTEGECITSEKQYNLKHILRCIAGFMIHPNVGGVIVVSTGREVNVTKDILIEFVRECNQKCHLKEKRGEEKQKEDEVVVVPYPTCCFEEPHAQWIEYPHPNNQDHDDNFLTKLDEAVQNAVKNATQNGKLCRTPCPLSSLTLALQCGGSDSFSGLTGNPLAGAITSHLIHNHQSRAILAESPELIGAEPYILSNVSSHKVASQFIEKTESYKKYAQRHDQSAAGNPSGGNLYRGLYNIVLKSLGAARKKASDVTLDCVLDYGEPMMRNKTTTAKNAGIMKDDYEEDEKNPPPYYAFMDSPGNDLESIAGQVSSQCNLILFITGNGSLSNFPFVPTIKIVTTTARFDLLQNEMDVDAGLYGGHHDHGGDHSGGRDILEKAMQLCIDVASRRVLSKGELAGHYQVSIWRNWAMDTTTKNAENEEADDTKKKGKMIDTDNNVNNDEKCMKENAVLQLCSKNAPHRIRPDLPPLPASLMHHAPIERRKYCPNENKETKNASYNGGASIFRPWSYRATRSLIPTSLCSSAVAQSIRESIIIAAASSSSPSIIDHHIACPSHTEGCGAAGDASSEHILQRLLLGHALHPSVDRVLFLEHGCEKTHNDFFQMVLNESGVLGFLEEHEKRNEGSNGEEKDYDWSEFFDFWSLQNDGGYEAAKSHVMDYFCQSDGCRFGAKNDDNSCQHPNARLFGVPWNERPISVGIMIDSAVLTGHTNADDDGSLLSSSHQLALALSNICRLLSFLNVTPILPANSPLMGDDSPSTTATVSATQTNAVEKGLVSHGLPTSASDDMEDYFSSSQRKSSGPDRSNNQNSPMTKSQTTKDNKALQHGKVPAGTKSSASAIFAAETLIDATIPTPTLLPGQMIHQQNQASTKIEQRGLHIMDIPPGATWDETISCLSPSCDVILLIAHSQNILVFPGSCLVPTLRRAIPMTTSSSLQDDDVKNAFSWSQWTVDTCNELLNVLQSPLVCGGEKEDDGNLNNADTNDRLFSLTTFVVPRGNAVSM